MIAVGVAPSYHKQQMADPDYAIEFAKAAERLGCESLWTVEHVVVPASYDSTYPYDPSGKMALLPTTACPDPLDWLAFVASATSTIRLATGMVILPEHNPVILAKRAATIDTLSRGRLMLGVGVGWLREEFDALGVPFAERGARADEYIAAMRVLWRDRPAAYAGRFVAFDGVASTPAPAQPGGVPIHIGGHSAIAARRAGRDGDGFFPLDAADEDLASLVALMRTTAVDHGRDPDRIEITARGSTKPETIDRYLEAGVSRMLVVPREPGVDGLERMMERLRERVLDRF